jgi:hypothetical protein
MPAALPHDWTDGVAVLLNNNVLNSIERGIYRQLLPTPLYAASVATMLTSTGYTNCYKID